MDEYNVTLVNLKSNTVIMKTIEVVESETTDEIFMRVTLHRKKISVVDENYLPAYQKLRDILLVMGYGIKCYGSCINAVQSGMMGANDKMYLVTLGKQAVMKDIVHLFDYLDIKEFPDTQAQLNYLETWYTSL